jgi:hypothetical protein
MAHDGSIAATNVKKIKAKPAHPKGSWLAEGLLAALAGIR